jgi:hypothetical protein
VSSRVALSRTDPTIDYIDTLIWGRVGIASATGSGRRSTGSGRGSSPPAGRCGPAAPGTSTATPGPFHYPAAGHPRAWPPLRARDCSRRAGVPDGVVPLEHFTGGCVVEPCLQARVLLDPSHGEDPANRQLQRRIDPRTRQTAPVKLSGCEQLSLPRGIHRKQSPVVVANQWRARLGTRSCASVLRP